MTQARLSAQTRIAGKLPILLTLALQADLTPIDKEVRCTKPQFSASAFDEGVPEASLSVGSRISFLF